MHWLGPLGGFGLIVALVGWMQEARAQAPVVLEFFTSQGCSSCPPADEIFSRIVGENRVIALALHVDYWDYLGWQDTFGREEHTERQRLYAKAHGERTIYTPQMIVQGSDIVMGHEEGQIRGRIAAHEARPRLVDLDLRREGGAVEIVVAPHDGPVGDAEIHVVEFVPRTTMTVEGGENAGYHHTFLNVVTGWATIGRWDGASRAVMRHAARPDLPVAVLVQTPQNGPILSAAQLP